MNLEDVDNVDINNNLQVTTALRLERRLRADDDTRVLACRSQHLAYPEPQDTRYQLIVRRKMDIYQFKMWYWYPFHSILDRPIALPETNIFGLILGSSATINITIRANPRPRVEWLIDGQLYREGIQGEKYSVYQVEDLGGSFYNATLTITSLTFEDTTKLYTLKASNEFGVQDYSVRISSSESQPRKLQFESCLGGDFNPILFFQLIVALVLVPSLESFLPYLLYL